MEVFSIKISNNSLIRDIADSEAVIGTNSMAFLTANLMKKKIYNILFGKKIQSPLKILLMFKVSKLSKNKIIVGTANFIKEYGLNRKKISASERRNILNYLKLRKILHFDVSDSYGNLGFENNFSNIRNKKINLKFNLKKIIDIEKYFSKV